MMMGISGAGKSTHVEKLIENHKKQYPDIDIVVVSRDIARVALGYCEPNQKYVGTSEEENMVTAYCNELIRESAEAGKHVIIDDMNIKKKYRDGFKNLLSKYFCFYEYHYVECGSFDVNVKRREGQVPKDVLHNMINSIEWPTGDEYDIMYISQN
jgi:predicted kinase